MTRRRGLIGLALMLGCTPELEPIHWDAVDIEALREAIANPTGIVDEASADEVGAAVVQRNEPYRVLSDYLHGVFVGDMSGDEGPVWVLPQALDGTSVYLIVACPGPLGADAPPFSRGSVRVDSPTLDAEVVSTFAVQGQLRLSFTACEIADYTFDGVAPAFHTAEPLALGFVPTLDFFRADQPDAVFELHEPVLWDASDRISVLFELDSGETLTLDWLAAQVELRLRGRNGELICTIAGSSLECVPP